MTLLRLPRDDVVRSDSKTLIEISAKSRNYLGTSPIPILRKHGYRAKPDFNQIYAPVDKKERDGEMERNWNIHGLMRTEPDTKLRHHK